MKINLKLLFTSLIAMTVALSCVKEEEQITFSSDPAYLNEVPCKDPADQVLKLITNANWIVVTPSWVKAEPNFGSGTTIVTLKVESTFINEKTDVASRTGELVFSGGGKSYKVPITQLGYTAPYDPSASIGGIPDLEELKKFVKAVNDNDGITRWLNANKEVELLADIDVSSLTEWTPIGNPETVSNGNYLGSYTGPAFKNVFNGANHTIRGFKPTVTVSDKGTFGFFGVLDHATVKDLNIETSLNISADGTADAGVLAGTVICSTIKNIKVSGSILSTGTKTENVRYALGGVAGFVFNTNKETSLVTDCTVNLQANVSNGSNTKNGATGTMYGGIAGFVTTSQDGSLNKIENCVSNGEITACVGRCSGVCATANVGGAFTACVNNANQVNTMVDGRIGNVVSVMGKNGSMTDCVNNGNLTTSNEKTTTGAILGFFNGDDIVMTGGKNTGTIISANSSANPVRGLIGANISKFTSITGVTVGGKLGVYKADGNHEMIDVNEGNFEQYIGMISDANRAKVSGLKWDGSSPAPTVKGIASAADLKEFASLVSTGGDYSKFVVDGEVVLGKDIDLGGEEWTPIGAATVTTAGAVTGTAFTAVFNGKGHTVDNFKINVAADAADGTAVGLFGVLNGATVKNVTIGSKVVIDSKSKAVAFLGGIAGFALKSSIEGCTNNASISLTTATDAKRECIGGIVGEAYSPAGEGLSSYVKNCKNFGVLTSTNPVNANNGGNGISLGGIVGFTDGDSISYVQNCSNEAAITAEATRLAGIVASANKNTSIEDCVNNGKISGKDIKASNSRIGGICSAASTGVTLLRCVNKADVEFPIAGDTTHGYAAGILGQANNPVSIEACENYGTVRSDFIKASTVYMGIIIGNPNSKAVAVKNCKVGGKIGPYVEDDTFKIVTMTTDNFNSYITMATSKAGSCTMEGNVCGN